MSHFIAVPRDKFLSERSAVTADAKASGMYTHVVDAEDEVICDLCNGEVTDSVLWIKGSYLYCQDCRRKGVAL